MIATVLHATCNSMNMNIKYKIIYIILYDSYIYMIIYIIYTLYSMCICHTYICTMVPSYVPHVP
jgi:hypothetical protein